MPSESNSQLEPVISSHATLPPARICEGFHQHALVTIYSSTSPCVRLCFDCRQRHMHLFAACENPYQIIEMIRVLVRDPDWVAENLLADVYDKATEPQRAGMEVTSQ